MMSIWEGVPAIALVVAIVISVLVLATAGRSS